MVFHHAFIVIPERGLTHYVIHDPLDTLICRPVLGFPMKVRYYSGQKAAYYWLMFFGIMFLLVSIVFISVAIFSEPEAIEQCTTDYVGEVTVDCSVYDKTLMIMIVPMFPVGLLQFVAIYHTIIWALEFWKRKSLADCIGEHAANLYVDLSRDVKVLKSEKYDEQTKEMIFGKIVSSLSGISPYIKGEEGHFLDLGVVVMESDTPRQEAVEMYNIVAGFVEPIFSEHKGRIREEKAAIRKAELDLALANKQLEIQRQQQTPQIIVQQGPQQSTTQKSPGLAKSILKGGGKLLAANYRWTQAAQAQRQVRRYYCTKCKRLQDFAHGGPHYCCGKRMNPK